LRPNTCRGSSAPSATPTSANHVQTWTWILHGDVDLGGLTPDPERQLLEFGPAVSVEIDARGDDGPAVDAEPDQAGEEWNAA
jgi:hypothetical protein